MTHPRFVQLAAIGALLGLLAGAAALMRPINDGRAALNMIGRAEALERVPPEYAFMIQAFGAFRSLITDIAFIRAEEYKQKGRYYDAMQLASWICKLQPHFPSVWEFNAWNMAWNISVTTYTPEERWNWVYNGVKLLRDEGIRYNPRAVNLYKQLAWTFNNKMGTPIDEHHLTYKRNWAWRMHLLLGPPPDPLGRFKPGESLERYLAQPEKDPLLEAARIEEERRKQQAVSEDRPRLLEAPTQIEASGAPPELADGGQAYAVTKKAALERIAAIAAAPTTLESLYAAQPSAREMVQQLRALGIVIVDDPLDEDSYWRDDGLAVTFFMRYRTLADERSLLMKVARGDLSNPDQPNLEQLDQIVGVSRGDPAGEALVRFLQRKVLSEVYKLDPAHMVYLMQEFGPIDWRVVDGQSLYWTHQALVQGAETISQFSNDKTNTARILFFSLRNLFSGNRMTFEPYPPAIHLSYFNVAPDINFIEPMHRAYQEYGPLIDPNPGGRHGVGETFRTGHINFLSEAIRILYFSDRRAEAERYYQYLRENYGRHDSGEIKEEYLKPLDQYVTATFKENITTYKEALAAISSLLTWSYDELAEEGLARYNNLVRQAYEVHQRYGREYADPSSERQRLPAFVDMQADALRLWLAQPAVTHVQTLHKARLWGWVSENLRLRVYDDLKDGLAAECETWDFDVAKAFPEPAGMAAFREAQQRRGPKPEDRGVETPAQQPG